MGINSNQSNHFKSISSIVVSNLAQMVNFKPQPNYKVVLGLVKIAVVIDKFKLIF